MVNTMKRAAALFGSAFALVAAMIAIWGFLTGRFTLPATLDLFRHPTSRHPAEVDLSSPAWLDSLPARETEIPRGGAADGFSYDASGGVRFRGQGFAPSVQFTPADNPAILVSQPSTLPLAAAIVGLDRDGQRTFYVVHLDSMTSAFCKCPSSKRFWSPDRRHLVSLDAYEGQWFTVFDITTGSFRTSAFLGHLHSLWYLEGTPKWSPDGRLLFAKAVETMTPFDSDSSVDAETHGPIDTFRLTLDTQTLEITPPPSSDR